MNPMKVQLVWHTFYGGTIALNELIAVYTVHVGDMRDHEKVDTEENIL